MVKPVKKEEKKVEEQSNVPFVVKDEHGSILAEYPRELVDTIKQTVAKGATDEELYMFLQIASTYGLNPFMKEIWFTKFQNKRTGKMESNIMTSRDGFAKLAKRDPNFKKCQSVAVYENDEFEMVFEMGEVTGVKHSFKQKDRGTIVGAYAVLIDKNNDTLVSYVDFKEYDQRNSIWKKYPTAMIRKIAENDVYKRFANIDGLCAVEDMPHPYILDANTKDVSDFNVIDTEVVE